MAVGEWSEVLEPIAVKFSVGANFGDTTTFNREGSASMAKLLRDVAARADAGIDVLHNIRRQLVDISSEITSRETFAKCDDDELEPIEAMIAEIDAVLPPPKPQ